VGSLTPSNARAVLEAGFVAEREVRTGLGKALDGLSEEQWLYQAFPGANHVLWNIAHLASVDVWFIGTVGGNGQALAKPWMDAFATGSKPEAGVNPSVADVRAAFDAARAALVGHLRSLSDEDLLIDCGEVLKHSAPTRAHMPALMAWHDADHLGQVFMTRRALGLGYVFRGGS
jgi:hypothetical protein